MTNTDNAFVQGMLKQAEALDNKIEKHAYGARLTALLQRKGKIPAETKPTVGVSSFPTIKRANAFSSAMPLAGAFAGYSKENPVFGPVVGGLAGYGLDQAMQNGGGDLLLSGLDRVPGFKDFREAHPTAGMLGAGAGAFLGGAGLYKGLSYLNNRFKRPSRPPAASLTDPTDIAKTANEELLAKLQEYLSQAGQSAGHGAMHATDFMKHHPVGTTAIGAGVGGLAGALTGKSENKETGEKGTRGRNALIGALLGAGGGAAAHHYGVPPAEQAIFKARTSGLTPQPGYSSEYSPAPNELNPLQVLKQLGLAPLNVGQNAPPSSLSVKPRF